RDLEVVTRDRLVVRRRGETGVRPRGQVERVHVVGAGPGRVGGGLVVVRERRVALLVLLDRDHAALRPGDAPEHAGCRLVRATDVLDRARDQRLPALGLVVRVVGEGAAVGLRVVADTRAAPHL